MRPFRITRRDEFILTALVVAAASIQVGWNIIMGPDIPIVVSWVEFTAFFVYSLVLTVAAQYIMMFLKTKRSLVLMFLALLLFEIYWSFQLFSNTIGLPRPITLILANFSGFSFTTLLLIFLVIRLSFLFLSKIDYDQVKER